MLTTMYFDIPVLITLIFLVSIIPSGIILTTTYNFFGTTNFAYGQTNQTNTNNESSGPLNIQNVPVKRVHVGDINIAYKTFGKGEPFLLISGAGMNMDAWEPSILRNLSTNHSVIIFDNRGVGNTTTGTKPFSVQQYVNDTVGLLEALKIQKADVLGFSQGSFTAQQLTITHPEKVMRLILYAASCGGKESIPPNPEFFKSSRDYISNLSKGVITPHSGFTLNTVIQQNKVGLSWLATNWSGICDQLQNISKPTLVIAGTDDVVPVANSLVIATKIPGAWVVQIRNAGHDLMYQYPVKFNKVLQAFLSTTTTNPH